MHETYGWRNVNNYSKMMYIAQTYAVLVKPTISIGEDGQPIVGAPNSGELKIMK